MAKPLHDEIRAHVLNLIRSEQLSTGDRISDQHIAETLDISRTPVRRVLTQMTEEGWTEKAPRGWRVVAEPQEVDSGPDRLSAQLLMDYSRGAIGQELFESDLMQRFGSSRATIKRMMERLSADGLVTRRRGHGWRFADALAAPDAIRDSYVFRELLECGALERDDWTDDPVERADLEKRHLALLKVAPGELGPGLWFDTNSRLHDFIARGSRNGFVIRALEQQTKLRRLLEYAEFAGLSEDRIRASCHEHLAILEAIGRGANAEAAELLRQHLRRAAH